VVSEIQSFLLPASIFYPTFLTVMTLGNMRENGVRSLTITCGALWCHHQAVLDVESLPMM